MKGLKKILFAAAAFVATLTIAGGVKVNAATGTIGLNEEKEFRVVGKEENVIDFKTPATGSFHVEVVLVDTISEEGKSVNFGNVTINTKLVNNYKTLCDVLGTTRDKGWQSTPEYCLPKGNTVSIKISGNFDKTTFVYKVKVVNKPNKYFEKENNGTAKKATSLKLKKTYSGIINDKEDVDWYVFKATKAGKYKFSVVNTEDYHSSIGFTAYKSKTKAVGNTQFVYNGDGWKKLCTVSLKKGQKYYVKVDRSYNKNATYKIKVTKTK